MPKGVSKIKYTGHDNYPKMGGGNTIVMEGGKQQTFQVSEWVAGTKKEDQDKVIWFLEDSKRSRIIKTYPGTGSILKVTIPKKLSGSKAVFYLEAAATGKPDKKNATGLLIRGYCPPVILSSKWSTRMGGDNIKNGTPISYGQNVFLHLETEGLNGADLTVELYNRQLGDDEKIFTYNNVQVIEGEVNLEIRNTFSWFAKVGKWIQKTEDFYIKVKYAGNYLVDEKKQALHAVYLKVDNNIVSRKVDIPVNNSPVKIGKADEVHQAFDHCGYSAVVIREDKREVEVFNEKSKGNGLIVPFEIVAGEGKGKKKFSISLEGEDISKCGVKPKHDKDTIFTYDENTKKWVSKKTEKQLDLEIEYDYGTLNMLAGVTILQYIWPLRAGAIQKYKITATTCRYKKIIPVNVFPDVEWELNFEYAAENPAFYGDSWQKMTKYRVEDAWTKTQAASLEGYDGKYKTEFSLALAAKWNGGSTKTDMAPKYAPVIKDFLGVFMKTKKLVDSLSHRDLADSVVMNKLLKNPFTMQIDYPKIAIGAGWKLETNPNAKEKAVLMAEGKIGFYPLLAGKGKLDLLALTEKLPVVGQVINLLDWAATMIKIKPVFELAAVGEINVGIELKKNFSKSRTDFEVSLNGKFGLRLEISVKASGTVQAVVFSADYSFEASGVAESYFLPKVSGGTDDLGAYINGNLDFSGVTIILVVKGTFGKGSRSKEVKLEVVEKKENILKGQYYFIKNT